MNNTLAAVAVGLVLLAGYTIACWLWPFAACLRCGGDGKRRSPSGKAWRRCGRCKGTGERVRIGRRIWTWWTNTDVKGRR